MELSTGSVAVLGSSEVLAPALTDVEGSSPVGAMGTLDATFSGSKIAPVDSIVVMSGAAVLIASLGTVVASFASGAWS